jgi:hypothetical protein
VTCTTVETLFITVAKQRNNGSDQRFLWGPFTGYIVQSYGDSYQLLSDGRGSRKSWLQSWIRSLQRKRRESVVVSYKVYTL